MEGVKERYNKGSLKQIRENAAEGEPPLKWRRKADVTPPQTCRPIDPTTSVQKWLDRLQDIQTKEGCEFRIQKLIAPFIRATVVRVSRGQKIITLDEFLQNELCCHKCYHHDHIEELCADRCCDERRCARCLHPHGPEETCFCDHIYVSKMIKLIKLRYPPVTPRLG